MYQNVVLGLVAQTSIHAGASSSEAAIDLPIQREVHTDWPVIFGSGVKGALRSHFDSVLDKKDLFAIFGPDTDNASDYAGALLVSDARLLLLPVRSMTSHVKWVTCPALLKRLFKDLQRAGLMSASDVRSIPAVSVDKAVTPANADKLYLEEFRFTAEVQDLSALITQIAKVIGSDLEEELMSHLVVVGDDQFRHLCRNAVPVQAHNAIDSTKKTVSDGALWYEESLPSETVMYTLLSCSNGRDSRSQQAAELLKKLEDTFDQHNFVQIGGNLTTGMGWFALNWLKGAN